MSLVRATPRRVHRRYRQYMTAGFVWIILGIAVLVLVLIMLYVDRLRR